LPVDAARARRGCPVPAGRRLGVAHASLCATGARSALNRRPCPAPPAPRNPPYGAPFPAYLPPAAARAFDLGPAHRGALMAPTGKDSLLIIVPAYNEEGAVGGVVRSIRLVQPSTHVTVMA